jgi:hypothetical protein
VRIYKRLAVHAALVSMLVAMCAGSAPGMQAGAVPKEPVPGVETQAYLNRIAEGYVKLALAVGEHDPMYVDAYYGPEEWRAEAKKNGASLEDIDAAAAPLIQKLKQLDVSGEEEIVQHRAQYLAKQLASLSARVAMLEGKKFSFDEESMGLYDAVAPHYDESHFKEALARIDSLVPRGPGTLQERIERFKKDLIIPKDKLDAVFSAAIAEARRRTKEHIALPENESFTVEYVTNQPWSAYNWYKGNNRSVIQINTDLPKYIDAPVGLACHEGYPGHHVQNAMCEQHLAKERGWIEFTISPLFCPQSLLNEGAANFGIDVAFPGNERLAFERDVLYPLAGLDPAKAETYFKIQKAVGTLSYAEDEAARRYLDGQITAEEAARFISTYSLVTMERARKLVTFIDQYRSYVINYNVGYDLMKNYIARRGGTEDRPEARWRELGAFLSSPQVPSALK